MEDQAKKLTEILVITNSPAQFFMNLVVVALLPAIAEEFHHAYNVYKNVGEASVTTAVPLDDKLRGEIEKIVKKLSDKKEVEIKEKVDAEMIGGFVLNVGDRQIDASIKNKLKSLKVKFSENPYIKEF